MLKVNKGGKLTSESSRQTRQAGKQNGIEVTSTPSQAALEMIRVRASMPQSQIPGEEVHKSSRLSWEMIRMFGDVRMMADTLYTMGDEMEWMSDKHNDLKWVNRKVLADIETGQHQHDKRTTVTDHMPRPSQPPPQYTRWCTKHINSPCHDFGCYLEGLTEEDTYIPRCLAMLEWNWGDWVQCRWITWIIEASRTNGKPAQWQPDTRRPDCMHCHIG